MYDVFAMLRRISILCCYHMTYVMFNVHVDMYMYVTDVCIYVCTFSRSPCHLGFSMLHFYCILLVHLSSVFVCMSDTECTYMYVYMY